MKRWFRLGLLICSSALFALQVEWTLPSMSAQSADRVDFARDIQPLFAAHCLSCHGAQKASGQLRLDTREAAIKGGISGAALVPGQGKTSRLVARLRGEGGEQQMPLKAAPLNPAQIALIQRWIDEGALWPANGDGATGRRGDGATIPHWAYKKPVRPALPVVKNQKWARNPIDAFVLARLEKEGLQPSPEADRVTLLRRVYFDLIGLPPTLPEADAFLHDKSPDAYEKLVDRLLASPHYGERQARAWLDLARYADSHGYEKDRPRVMWKYRDWVVNAFNQDKSFDQFTIEQLAGDLLPNPTNDQLIATGFHRNTMLNQEGGVDDEEARWEVNIDRVSTTATVWLGSTLGCAQCHNHKYDPFKQREFYQMFAFFDSHQYEMLVMPGSEGWVIEPELELPTPEQAQKRDALRAELKTIEAALKTQTPTLDAAMAQWEDGLRRAPERWQALAPNEFKSTGGARLEKLDDHSLRASGAAAISDMYVMTTRLPAAPKGITALRLEAMADPALAQGGPGRDPYGNFVLTGVELQIAPTNNPAQMRSVQFKEAEADDSSGRPNAAQLFSGADQPGNGWAIDATRDEQRLNRQIVFTFAAPLVLPEPVFATIHVKQIGKTVAQGLGRIRLSVTESDTPLQIVSLPLRFQRLLQTPADKRSESQRITLADQFRQQTPLLKGERDRARALRDQIGQLGIVTAQIMREKPSSERPSTEMRLRGNYVNRGERVYAATPAALHAWPSDAPVNRLGLARWLVSPENPLMARVTVNRMWEQFFGRGMVETSEDFGAQSAAPSHPELLDWLAVSFKDGIAEGKMADCGWRMADCGKKAPPWSVKALHRLMVTSATYRQSSRFNPQSNNPQSDDPYNRLLSRGPRMRMEAEMIRDAALTASGLLSRNPGGAPVYPVQPDGIWMNPYDGTNIRWTTSSGADLYRRSLYTFLRRTAPYPMMTNFDATSRESCTVRRARTNTPLQALNLLNDEAFFTMARALARRMLTEVQGDVATRLAYGFRLCLTRKPTTAELAKLTALYEKQLALYRADTSAAGRVARDVASNTAPEQAAAMTMIANTLLNLDEMVTKE
ncbi:MAG: PSD1 and planctomycete cytochrome C domain-containing protein [Blastocatellia bacterium]